MRALINFLRLVLENLKKYHKGDFAGTAPYLITFDPLYHNVYNSKAEDVIMLYRGSKVTRSGAVPAKSPL